ncbi:hypothetical protein TNCV_4612521 [Trichonephila clavipes]|nr:hypothetical protein TNCV_4612521 [Trichonephila clavipes]
MAWWRGFNRTILNNLSLMVSKNQQDWDQSSSLSASVPQRRLRDYRIFTIPDAFWPRSSSHAQLTCCLVALRIHLHRLRVRAESPGTFLKMYTIWLENGST